MQHRSPPGPVSTSKPGRLLHASWRQEGRMGRVLAEHPTPLHSLDFFHRTDISEIHPRLDASERA